MKTAKKLLSLLLCMCMVMTCGVFTNVYATCETHTYGAPAWFWAEDYSSVRAVFLCTEGDDTQIVNVAAPNVIEVSAATCTDDQVVTYTATISFNGANYSDTKYNITVKGTALGHSYDEGKKVDPTCTTRGYTEYTCTVCGDVIYRDIEDPANAALGHDFGAWAETTAVSCTTSGEEKRVCSREGCDAFETRAIVPEGHDFDDWAVTTAPTCVTDGQEMRNCKNCEVTETKVLAALGHDYAAVVTAPTCTEDGYTTFTCTRCTAGTTGYTYTDDDVTALGHSYTAVTTKPTCTTDGYTTYTCSACSDTYTDNTTPALGHSYNAVTTKPTCTEGGYTTYTCSVCGDNYTDDQVPALGHSYEAETTEATCLTAGYTTYTCTRCDDTYTANNVDALGHCYDIIETLAPTCTEDGYMTYICSRCPEGTEGHTKAGVTIPALGHSFDENDAAKVNVVEATCTTDGKKTVTCQRCAETVETTIPALGHSYDAFETVAPTCTTEGSTTYVCKRCAEGTEGHTKAGVTIPALGHSYDAVVTKEPTCTEDGATTYICTRCAEGTEGHTKDGEVIPALGHIYEFEYDGTTDSYKFGDASDHHKILPATVAHGERHVFTCTRSDDCNQTFTIEVESTRKEDTRENHNYGDHPWTECEKPDPDNGNIGKCTNTCIDDDCTSGPDGGKYVAIREHDVRAWTYEKGTATCYFNGYETGTCVLCKAQARRVKQDDSQRPAHTFACVDNGNGTHTRQCVVCEKFKEDHKGVMVKNHEGKDVSVDQATYLDEYGVVNNLYYLAECIVNEHNFTEWEYQNDETFFKNGHSKSVCKECGSVHPDSSKEVIGSSGLARILSKILGKSVFAAWIYTGISFALARWFGASDKYLIDPLLIFRKK